MRSAYSTSVLYLTSNCSIAVNVLLLSRISSHSMVGHLSHKKNCSYEEKTRPKTCVVVTVTDDHFTFKYDTVIDWHFAKARTQAERLLTIMKRTEIVLYASISKTLSQRMQRGSAHLPPTCISTIKPRLMIPVLLYCTCASLSSHSLQEYKSRLLMQK